MVSARDARPLIPAVTERNYKLEAFLSNVLSGENELQQQP
jgi:hypothetical protein